MGKSYNKMFLFSKLLAQEFYVMYGFVFVLDCTIHFTRYSRKVPGLVHFKGYLTSIHYEIFQITNHIHFLYFTDKLRKEYEKNVLKWRLTYGIYEGTEHFENPLNRIF